jgi:hypothetical protein
MLDVGINLRDEIVYFKIIFIINNNNNDNNMYYYYYCYHHSYYISTAFKTRNQVCNTCIVYVYCICNALRLFEETKPWSSQLGIAMDVSAVVGRRLSSSPQASRSAVGPTKLPI